MKIKCVKIPCEQDNILGSCQCFYNGREELKYARIRHYDKVASGKPKFIYNIQTLSYVSAQLDKLNQQNLSSSKESNTVVSGSEKANNNDLIGHTLDSAIDLRHREPSTKTETGGWSSSLVRTLALRAKGRRSESGSAHHIFCMAKLKNEGTLNFGKISGEQV
jgi:hypothetical protein